ncbi:MAG TPA: hypothetical protein VN831_18130 [Bradyrhizobium sp.]|nr:hypothetical protein [Bradyrhizobium sp.]
MRLTNDLKPNTVRNMARARFEKIDEIQNDAIKLMLKREKGRNGVGHIPGNRKRQPTER